MDLITRWKNEGEGIGMTALYSSLVDGKSAEKALEMAAAYSSTCLTRSLRRDYGNKWLREEASSSEEKLSASLHVAGRLRTEQTVLLTSETLDEEAFA